MTKLLAIWAYLNGKKTTIGAYCLAIVQVSNEFLVPTFGISGDWFTKIISTLTYVGGILVAGGLLHKGVKATGLAQPPTP